MGAPVYIERPQLTEDQLAVLHEMERRDKLIAGFAYVVIVLLNVITFIVLVS